MGHRLINALGVSEAIEQGKRIEAMKTYRRLLEADSDKPADLQAFKEACQILGKKSSDVSADHRLLVRARELQQRVRAGSGLDPKRHAAAKAIEASMLEKEQLLREWANRHHQALAAQSAIEQEYMEGQNAQRLLHDFLTQHAQLLGHLEMLRLDGPGVAETPERKPAA